MMMQEWTRNYIQLFACKSTKHYILFHARFSWPAEIKVSHESSKYAGSRCFETRIHSIHFCPGTSARKNTWHVGIVRPLKEDTETHCNLAALYWSTKKNTLYTIRSPREIVTREMVFDRFKGCRNLKSWLVCYKEKSIGFFHFTF